MSTAETCMLYFVVGYVVGRIIFMVVELMGPRSRQ